MSNYLEIGISPSDEFSSKMLKETHESIPGDTHPIIHSNKGCTIELIIGLN